MKEYIRELTDYLKDSILTLNKKDKFITQVDDFHLNLETSVSVGLILNELITNSIKHGFTNSDPKELKVKAHLNSDNLLHLEVSDNGKAFPSDFSMENDSNFGLDLVRSLASQFNGRVEVQNKPSKSVNIILAI